MLTYQQKAYCKQHSPSQQAQRSGQEVLLAETAPACRLAQGRSLDRGWSNPVLDKKTGQTATDAALVRGSDQSSPPSLRKAPPHRPRAGSGEAAGPGARFAAPPRRLGPFGAPPPVPRLLLPPASRGEKRRWCGRAGQGRAGRGAGGTNAQGQRSARTDGCRHFTAEQEQTPKAAPGRESSVLPTHPASARAWGEPHLSQVTEHSYSLQTKAPVRREPLHWSQQIAR